MTTRDALVGEIRNRLILTDYPRLTILIILSMAGGVAFLTSFWTLSIGLDWMAPRYALASIAGYLAFVGLIRAWIAIRRGEWDDAHGDLPDPFDWAEFNATSGGGGGDGGGASPTPEPVESVTSVPRPSSASNAAEAGKGGDFPIGLDDGVVIILIAIVAALCGLICIAYVVYIAPLLLAEVALDAALVSAAYRRLRREDVEHWTGPVLRRTLAPAAILVFFMFVAGFAAQQFAPDARSIGGVVRALVW